MSARLFVSRFFHSSTAKFAAVLIVVLASTNSAFCSEIDDAVRNGDLEKVKALVKNDPSLVFSKDKDGWTPLHYAALNGRKEIVEFLLASHADVNARDNDEETPLFVSLDRPEVAEVLLRHGANVDARNKKEGIAPLGRAASEGNQAMVKLLLSYKADIKARDNEEYTALHDAAERGHAELAELLLARGADPNARVYDRRTPLHMAAQGGHPTVVRVLLAHGAAVDAREENGTTPLFDAVMAGDVEIAAMLLSHGARIDLTNNDGFTPFLYALPSENAGMIALLRSYQKDTEWEENLYKTQLARGEGREADAEQFCLAAIKRAEESRENYARLAASLNTLGLIYGDEMNYPEAEKAYQRALQIREQHLGSNDPAVATSLVNLGEVYENQGDYAKAEPLYKRALTIRQATLSWDSGKLASARTKLAGVYLHQAQCSDAVDLSSQSLAIKERVGGTDNPLLTVDLTIAGNCDLLLGNYSEAELAFRRALEINKKVSKGGKSSYVGADLGNLAIAALMQGRKTDFDSLARQSAEVLLDPAVVPEPQTPVFLGLITYFYFVEGEQEKSISLAQQAVEKGVLGARQGLADLRVGQLQLRSPFDLALLGRLAPHGSPVVQNATGLAYQFGRAAPRNYGEALKWYRMAADQGYAPAENNVGWMYDEGLGIEVDNREANKWYSRGAQQGHASAENNLGMAYLKGKGVEQNYAEALRWFQLSAAQDHTQAESNLGTMYERGEGVTQDYKRATALYLKAAETANPNAYAALGSMYQRGAGVASDMQQAYSWYLLAADHMSVLDAEWPEVVRSGLATLGKQLTPDQLASAHQSAQEWIARNRLVVTRD